MEIRKRENKHVRLIEIFEDRLKVCAMQTFDVNNDVWGKTRFVIRNPDIRNGYPDMGWLTEKEAETVHEMLSVAIEAAKNEF